METRDSIFEDTLVDKWRLPYSSHFDGTDYDHIFVPVEGNLRFEL